ncbi:MULTISPECIES: hypothetical protein [Streptomyces]|uniref:hypothetical protein n=1 Tax=Streptomyces TaxID=1883 RepID=UPI001C309123|nr:hypothetical protein [Streptomyces sp. GbtcB7]
MLDPEEAERRAAEFLAEESSTWGMSSNVRIITEYCFTDRGRFIAPYDHVEYLDHGREDMQLGGNLPVAVDLSTGACSFITREDAEDMMERDLL